MLPTNDQITACRVVPVVFEITTVEFKLDTNSLPAILPAIYAALRLTIGIR